MSTLVLLALCSLCVNLSLFSLYVFVVSRFLFVFSCFGKRACVSCKSSRSVVSFFLCLVDVAISFSVLSCILLCQVVFALYHIVLAILVHLCFVFMVYHPV